MSCDAYSDLWRPFFALFFRYWPDRPFPVVLGSTQLVHDDSRVRTITTSPDATWSEALIECLDAIETPYVLLMLEDFFLRRPTDTGAILTALEFLENRGGAVIRLTPRPGPDLPAGENGIGEISERAPYRVSTQGAIWDRAVLRSLVDRTETAWAFEEQGTKRSRAIQKPFFATSGPVLPYDHHVVQRGKWFLHEARWAKRANIGADFTRRQIMTPWEMALWAGGKIAARVRSVVPRGWRSR